MNNSSAIIYNDDCINILKDMKEKGVMVDAIITDPPYNISQENNFHTLKRNGKMVRRNGLDFGEWDKGFNQFEWLDYIPHILKKGGNLIIFNSWQNLGEIAKYCESLGFMIKDFLRWEKSNPFPKNIDRRYVTDGEFAIWLVNKGGKWTFNRQDAPYQVPKFVYPIVSGKEKTAHTTQKPIKLMEDLIKIHTNENDLVLDCFMGSGTTGVACLGLNRRFIGIELDNNYFEIAKSRINNVE